MNTEPQACNSTPHETLIGRILDSRIPKNEEGWAARREIERLRAEVAKLTAAQANMIDTTGAVEATCFSYCEVIGREPFGTYRDVGRVEVPKEWAGRAVLVALKP